MKKIMTLLSLLVIGFMSVSQGFASEITEADRQRMIEAIDKIQSTGNSN